MSIKAKEVLKNITKIGLSDILQIIAGVIVGFLLPKYLGVKNYGYFKTFTLYITYGGLLQFGISEGIYLMYGALDYEDIDKEIFRYYSKTFTKIQMVVSLISLSVSFFISDQNLRFTCICISIFIGIQNLMNYFRYISQITNQFDNVSKGNIIKSFLSIISVIVVYLIYKSNGNLYVSFKTYDLIYIMIFVFVTLWYALMLKEISIGKVTKPNSKNNIISLIELGAPLLLSDMCTGLLLNIDRQFVNNLFDIETYGSYSFAYNILSLVTAIVPAISLVIYPTFKRISGDSLKNKYADLLMLLSVFLIGMMISYFPINWFICYFFADQPKFIEALPIFRIMLPCIVISTSITIINNNFFKVFNLVKDYFRIVVLVLIISICVNVVAYKIYMTTTSISIASMIVTIIWYFISCEFLKNKIQISYIKPTIYILANITVFYVLTSFIDNVFGMLAYILFYVLVTVIFNLNKLKKILNSKNKNIFKI